MHDHSAGRFTAHAVHYVLPHDVAAVYGDVGVSDGGANVGVDFVPAVEVRI